MEKLFYLGYYDTPENEEEKRNIVLAATNKMTYVISALERLGFCVNVISASNTRAKKMCDEKIANIGKQSKLFLPRALPWGNKIRRIKSVLYSRYSLRKTLLEKIKDGDTLVVYHALPYAKMIKKLKQRRKVRLVLEVEEIYADVNGRKADRRKEFALFKLADAFIFPTESLNKKLNTKNKPYVIVHGTYQAEEELMPKALYRAQMGWDNGKTHIVYAGTFDVRKGGALASTSACEFLSDKHHLHIIGFGTEEDKNKIIAELERASRISGCTATFDGLLSGEDYIKFIQGCDIGLSTHNPNADFNDTSFPSKILSYMANGLRVVSVRIPVVEESAIGGSMFYYDEQTPEQIAEAIKCVDLHGAYDSRALIAQLDRNFVEQLKQMLEK